MITLIEELDRAGDLARVGDVGYVSGLFDGVPDRPSIQHYIGIVKDHAHRRKLTRASDSTIARLNDGDPTRDVAAGMLETVLDIEEQSNRSRVLTPKDFMADVLRDLECQAASDGLIGLPTGLSCLDEVTGGLRAGELVVIGARPGAGKSALAAQIAMANVQVGNPVGFFSLEMSHRDLGRRFLAAVSSVESYRIRDPQLIGKKKDDSAQWRSLASAAGKIVEWPLFIDDNGSSDIHQIVARSKMLISRNKAKVIIVDYLQLVRADIADIRTRVGHVADQLRILAKTEQVSVVLLSQLRRPQNVNDEPTLIDLKESGDIEAHAHIVLLIHSPLGPDLRPSGEQKMIVAKNRNGMRGAELVTFSESKLMFFPRTTRPQQGAIN